MDIYTSAKIIKNKIVNFRRYLHMNPEISMNEFNTTKKLAEELDKVGVSYRLLEPTGLIAEIHGKKQGRTIALRADIDALSVTEKSNVEYKSKNVGIMHACGHDAHTSMLLGSILLLKDMRDNFSGSIRFIFQPAEETGEGAKLVISQGGIEGVDAIFGLHTLTNMKTSEIAGCHGAAMAASDIFKIIIKGETCHGAAPQLGIDATVCGSALVMNLQTLVSREFSPLESLVVTVGSFHSGSRFNVCSGEAVLEGTIRTFSKEIHANIPKAFQRICKNVAAAYRCEAEVIYTTCTDVLVNDAELLDFGLECAKKVTKPELVHYMKPLAGGEDFAQYGKYTRAAYFRIGSGTNTPMHSDYFDIKENILVTGTAFYTKLALDYLENH